MNGGLRVANGPAASAKTPMVRVLVILGFACATWHGTALSGQNITTRGGTPDRDQRYIDMIKSAIVDETVVNTEIGTASRYGPERSGQVGFDLDVMIEPFNPRAGGFSTHVIYLVPGYGYAIRQVSIYPRHGLALFWLGYSRQGPGMDTGFHCTHSHSNCLIEDIPFSDLHEAFLSWWHAVVHIDIGDPNMARTARRRNAERAKVVAEEQKGGGACD